MTMPLPSLPLGGAKSLLCPLHVYMIQERIFKKERESHHCFVRADNLDYTTLKREYLKRNLPCCFLHAYACEM